MPEMIEISYTTDGATGKIQLKTSVPDFEERLREVEQTLADTGARDIVYVHRFVLED